MTKSIHTDNYGLFLEQLRKTRESSGFTQEQVAEKMEVTQTFISKCERGERRMDILEVRDFCRAIGVSFEKFIAALERTLKQRGE
ncbi:MAG: helix-turn-helix transcriptional regulator [Chloroflexi bacterium]|nr:helix-turn-helix transcriptional regulator [Chloroflexota bacterium]